MSGAISKTFLQTIYNEYDYIPIGQPNILYFVRVFELFICSGRQTNFRKIEKFQAHQKPDMFH